LLSTAFGLGNLVGTLVGGIMKSALPATDCLKWDAASLIGEGPSALISNHEASEIVSKYGAKYPKLTKTS